MQVGDNELLLEAPDLAVFRVRGQVTAADVETVARLLKEGRRDGTAYLLTLMETTKFEGSPEARRHFAETIRGLTTLVDAVVGANFRTRVILKFLESITRVISKMTLRVGLYDDEASAREWLRDQGCIACGAEINKP